MTLPLTVDLTPTPEGMRRMLRTIIRHGTNEKHREWASSELERIKDVIEWET